MAQQKEARLSQRIATALRKRGALVIKIAGGMYQTPGLSDLFVLDQGRFFAIEVKRPKDDGGPGCAKGLTDKQIVFLGNVADHGGISGCFETLEDVVEFVYGKETE
jgi:hypothetical protein